MTHKTFADRPRSARIAAGRKGLAARWPATHRRIRALAEYAVWNTMIGRCHRPASKAYRYYGGRGIAVCARWRRSAADFIQDMGLRPSAHHSIERIDNDGDYTPSNCRWATKLEQMRNHRRTRIIAFRGESLTLTEWSQRLGISHHTLAWRLRNWETARALTAPRTT